MVFNFEEKLTVESKTYTHTRVVTSVVFKPTNLINTESHFSIVYSAKKRGGIGGSSTNNSSSTIPSYPGATSVAGLSKSIAEIQILTVQWTRAN
jgi:uncharacterized membrane protein